jgi:hypothetical protein
MVRRLQPDLFAPAPGPPGFAYRPDVISGGAEEELAGRLPALPFEPFQFRGYEGRRRVVSFGLRYDFNGAGLVKAAPIPDWLLPLRAIAADVAGVSADAFAHLLVNEYTARRSAGTGIGRLSARWLGSRCSPRRSCDFAGARAHGSSGSASR